ncbi:MAG: LptF/LptG family permease [Cucumibacter sp.]
MRRLGLHLCARLGLSIGFVVVIMFGLVALIELIGRLSGTQGPSLDSLGWASVNSAVAAAYLTLETLPVYVLVGAILALIEMQRRHELVVMEAAGASVWRLLRLPVALTLLAGIGVSLVLDPLVLAARHWVETDFSAETPAQSGAHPGWLSHRTSTGRYFIHAGNIVADIPALTDVSVYAFDADGLPEAQFEAAKARLVGDRWVLLDGTRHDIGEPPAGFAEFAVASEASAGAVQLALGSAATMNYFELSGLLGAPGLEETARSVAQMRLLRLSALPLVLVGSLLIAFAFTALYRREGTSGATILYAILLGFVVFVVTRLVEQAGSAGILNPTIAAWGPAIVATVIGMTALLYLEDG